MKKLTFILTCLFILFSCNTWDTKQEETIEVNEKIQRNIIALWDSLTAWYNLDISESYPSQLEVLLKENWYNYDIINAWVSWDTSKNLLDRIGLYDEKKADIYLLNIWWNDWLRRQSIDDMKENISLVIKHLKEINPESKIVLFGMQIPINLWLNYSLDFKNSFEEIADGEDVYFYEFFLEWVAKDVKLNLSDSIHPNKQWYEIIAKNIYTFLEKKNLINK